MITWRAFGSILALPLVTCGSSEQRSADSPATSLSSAPTSSPALQTVAATPATGTAQLQQADVTKRELSVFKPKPREKIDLQQGPDGLYRFEIRGTSRGLAAGDGRLLLWVRPVRPPADGWYLQRGPLNGIGNVEPDGSWRGTAQIGNLQWPPHSGNVLDIAVSVVDGKTADDLLGATGVVVRGQPVGDTVATVEGIILALK